MFPAILKTATITPFSRNTIMNYYQHLATYNYKYRTRTTNTCDSPSDTVTSTRNMCSAPGVRKPAPSFRIEDILAKPHDTQQHEPCSPLQLCGKAVRSGVPCTSGSTVLDNAGYQRYAYLMEPEFAASYTRSYYDAFRPPYTTDVGMYDWSSVLWNRCESHVSAQWSHHGNIMALAGNKRKGGQVRFTPHQTQNLERRFGAHKYLSPEDRKLLANQLKLSDRQVKTWFQNRRAKWRRINNIPKGEEESEESPSDDEVSSITTIRRPSIIVG